jgi:UDP-3-O-acyl-N-acetylglucosamine deacetylase
VDALPAGRLTVAGTASRAGVGLHLGEPCTLTFRPAAPGSGVRFRRVDRPGAPEIPASAAAAVASERRTVLGAARTPSTPWSTSSRRSRR